VCHLVCVGVSSGQSCVCHLVCVGASSEQSCVCHWVCIVASSEQTHCVIFISPDVNYCHNACGSTTVTVRSIHVMYRYSPPLPTIHN